MRQNPIIKEYPMPIVGGTAFGRYGKISTEETFNMMVTVDDAGNKALVPLAGYRKVADLGGVGRQLYVSNKNQHMYAVADDNLFQIGQNIEVAEVGELATTNGDVYIAENDGNQIGIVDGLKPYTFNYSTNTFTANDDVDFLPNYIAYQGSYFIATGIQDNGQTNVFRLSDFNNGNSWPDDASHVGLLQNKADITQAAVPFNNQLIVFGKTVAQPWFNTGLQLFPYQENGYFSLDYGCLNSATIAVGSIQTGQNDLTPLMCWLGINEKAGPTIMYSLGGTPLQLSTDGINFKIEQLQHPENSYGFIFRLSGHTFYQIVWPMDNYSLAYDFNIHKFYTVTDQYLNYHIAKRVAFFNNKYYFLSVNDGGLYEMATDIYTYNGEEIPRIRILPPFRLPNSSQFCVNYIDLTLEQGESQQQQAIDISLSVDGGASYGSSGRQALNLLGNRLNRFREYNLGSANDFRLQFRFWGFDKTVITNGVMGVYQ